MTFAVPGAARTPVLGAALVVPTAAVAATGLTVSATGSMLVAAVLVGVATRDRWSGLAAVLATAAVAVRFGTTDLGDLAGIQSVLGAAGLVGPPTAAASAWAAAGAVLLAAAPSGPADGRDPGQPETATGRSSGHGPGAVIGPRLTDVLVAVAGGSFCAALVAGPGPGGGPDGWPGGGIGLRVVATVVAVGLSLVVGRARPPSRLGAVRTSAAVAAGMAAVVLAGWPA